MRRPRDVDAELKTLDERARMLRARKVTQLGDLVIACKADGLPAEIIAGALIEAAGTTDAARLEGWRQRGAAIFQTPRQAPPSARAATHRATAPGSTDGAASSAGTGEEPRR